MSSSFHPSLPSRITMLALLPLLFAGSVFTHPAEADEFRAGALVIAQPWSRATPSGAKIAVGYMTIENAGDTPDRLVAATAEVAGTVSAHSMGMDGGVMKMRTITDGIAIPAKGSAALKPGAFHLMFEGLKHPLKVGDTFPGTLTFAQAGTVAITFKVEAVGASMPTADHGAMKGMKMD